MQPPHLDEIPEECRPAFSEMERAGFIRNAKRKTLLMSLVYASIAALASILFVITPSVYMKGRSYMAGAAVIAAIAAVILFIRASFFKWGPIEPGFQGREKSEEYAQKIASTTIEKCACLMIATYPESAVSLASKWQESLDKHGFYREAAVWSRVVQVIKDIESGVA